MTSEFMCIISIPAPCHLYCRVRRYDHPLRFVEGAELLHEAVVWVNHGAYFPNELERFGIVEFAVVHEVCCCDRCASTNSSMTMN